MCCGLDNLASYLSINPAGHTPSPHREPLQPGHSLVPLLCGPTACAWSSGSWQAGVRRGLLFPLPDCQTPGVSKGCGEQRGSRPSSSPLFSSSVGDSSPPDPVSSLEWSFCSWSLCFHQCQPGELLLGAEPSVRASSLMTQFPFGVQSCSS